MAMKKKLLAALACAAIGFASTAQAATVGTLEGLGGAPGSIQTRLGALCAAPNTCQNIAYPNVVGGVPAGVTAANTWVANTSGTKIIVGYSEGAQVGSALLRQYATDPNAPSPADLSFVLIANPDTGHNPLANGAGIPADTPYHVEVVARQYDYWADYPNNPASPNYFLAALNVSMSSVHTSYTSADLTNPNNTVWQQGNITYVLVPTATLPLIAWTGPFAPALDTWLRPLVESAYIRPVPLGTKAAVSTAATSTAVPRAAPAPTAVPVVTAAAPTPTMTASLAPTAAPAVTAAVTPARPKPAPGKALKTTTAVKVATTPTTSTPAVKVAKSADTPARSTGRSRQDRQLTK